jgi:tight adherence protein C
MLLHALTSHHDLIVACTAALSVFCAAVTVFWSYLVPDVIGARMRRMANEREALRIRERGKLNSSKLLTLKTEPKKLFKAIFDRLNLAKQAEDGDMVQSLRMAGYRGQGPIVTFLAMRLIVPAVLFVVTVFYVFVVLQLDYSVFMKLTIAVAAALLGYYAPAIYVKNRITKRQKAIRRAWPDALDVLLICAESGMGVDSALRKVSEEIGPQSSELAEELALTTAELSYLSDRRTAYQNLAARTGLDCVRGVVTVLIQAEKYGTSVGQSLRVFSQEQRDTRISAAEKKAMSLPPKLTIPMIVFFMPVLFAILIAPGAIQMMGGAPTVVPEIQALEGLQKLPK